MSQLAKSVIHNQVLRLAERRFGAATLPENERHRALSKAFAMLATMQLLQEQHEQLQLQAAPAAVQQACVDHR